MVSLRGTLVNKLLTLMEIILKLFGIHRNRNDVVHWCKCPENDCDDFYIRETDRRISERIIDHNKRYKNSHPLKHAQNKKHAHVWVNDFTILNSNSRSKIKRKISDSL